jgi:hypothetical protein
MFNINDIISHINRNYLAKPHLYEVRIWARTAQNDASQSVMFNCSAISIPGTNIQYVQERRYGIGLNYHVVENKTFGEVIMTFYESELEKERKYFMDWTDQIFDPASQKLKFYRDFVRDIEIIQYNNKAEVVYKAILIDCIPANVGGLDRGYDKSEIIPSFDVNIQFQNIEETYFQKQ